MTIHNFHRRRLRTHSRWAWPSCILRWHTRRERSWERHTRERRSRLGSCRNWERNSGHTPVPGRTRLEVHRLEHNSGLGCDQIDRNREVGNLVPRQPLAQGPEQQLTD